MKDMIKNFAKDVGVDDIGFASIENYNSPNTPPIKEIYSKAAKANMRVLFEIVVQ